MSTTAPQGDGEPRLLVLDAFRAIAILGVMAHHYLTRYAPPWQAANFYGYRHTYPHWLDIGAMGVQFFFIISGFVIFMTLRRCRHLLEFWTRRLARLYPAYVVATFVTLVTVDTIGPAEFHVTLKDALVGLSFLTPYVPGAAFVEPAYWSLVVEMQFYVCIGLIYTLARERFATLWAAYVIAGTILSLLGTLDGWHFLGSVGRHVFLSAYTPYFTAGIIFYLLHCGSRKGCIVLASAALAEYVLTVPQPFGVWGHLASATMLVLFALFVYGRLKWLAVRPLVFLGSISYSLYLLHQRIGVSLIPYLTGKLHLPDLLAALSASLLCGLLAFALTRLVELPGKRWILAAARRRVFPNLFSRFPTLIFTPAPSARPSPF